jgi:phosphonate metabolism protein (transferase hexapeptide repeat family)
MIKYNSAHVTSAKRLTEEPTVAPTAVIKDTLLGRYTEVQEFSEMIEAEMDDYSYICSHCSVIYTRIGKFANIAAQVRINPGNHPYERPTQHHFTYRPAMYGLAQEDDEAFFNWRRIQQVNIGHDVWIGHGCIIMPGVSIGNGAIVGSHAVVTHNVPAYTIVAGSPAKVVRRRFPQSIAERIEASAWWDWDHETLRARLPDFKDIRTFLARYCC